MAPAIETSRLARSFGNQAAVAGVDLEVPERSVFGFLGPNGAGKTTTIRLLLGLLKPDAGSAKLFGLDVQRERLRTARLVGSMVETPSLYPHLTARENLSISCRLLRANPSEIDRVLELVDLSDSAHRRVGHYSLGMRQRVGVARALLGNPRILILDEPTNGLDPSGILDMRRLIAELPARQGATVFVSSHILAEVEQCATHVGLMDRGKLLLQSPMATLKTRQTTSVRIRTDRAEEAAALLQGLGHEARVQGPEEISVRQRSSAMPASQIAAMNQVLVEQGFAISAINEERPSLEDIFLKMIGKERNGGGADLFSG